ncbi:hypothetical protein L6164_007278 [Bauhinia variegata]|uniref:Uncharacterized protein n=1 Tax=Bauhinia variegata TaxID=167791 RepID=A0ACB9PD06_BAUVA|nr:hypothetical protein L6164_007278 [Bauhinia variegata]
MYDSSGCTVYIGNLDEKVTDRVLYDILIQAGRVVDLYIPRDKESDKPKGFAFAEYETEEIAEYAVKLFSGLVTLNKRTLKFAISGQDKPTSNLFTAITPSSNSSQRPWPPINSNAEISTLSAGLSTSGRFSEYNSPPLVFHQSSEHGSHYKGNNYNYSRRVLRATLDSIRHSRSRCYDASKPIPYPSY